MDVHVDDPEPSNNVQWMHPPTLATLRPAVHLWVASLARVITRYRFASYLLTQI